MYTVLKDTYLSPPQSKEEWLEISSKFEELWDIPHVIGCLDGKHIRIECPKLTEILYYNYKGFFSIVLLAIFDTNYCFSLFDLGQFESSNGSGVLASSQIGEMFEDEFLHMPEDRKLNDSDNKSLPYFLIGDEIFLLKKWLMRPFTGKNASEEEKTYNYRHSIARRIIESAFGILTARWSIFQKPIRRTVVNVERYTLACLALHSYLRLTNTAHNSPVGFIDSEDKERSICPGEWRLMRCNQSVNLQRLQPVKGSSIRQDILQTRNNLKNYLISEGCSTPWQLNYVRRTLHFAVQM